MVTVVLARIGARDVRCVVVEVAARVLSVVVSPAAIVAGGVAQCAGNLEQLLEQDCQQFCNLAPLASLALLGGEGKIASNLGLNAL